MVVVAEEDHVNHGGKHPGIDRPVIVVVDAHRKRQTSVGTIAADASVGVYLSYALALRVVALHMLTLNIFYAKRAVF